MKKKLMVVLFVSLAFLISACGGNVKADPRDEGFLIYAGSIPEFKIKDNKVENADPFIMFAYSNYLFKMGKKDDALYWYNLGNYRARYLNAIVHGNPPLHSAVYRKAFSEIGLPGSPILIGDIGRGDFYGVIIRDFTPVINGYAFANVDNMVFSLNLIMDYDKKHPFHPDKFLDKKYFIDSKDFRDKHQFVEKDFIDYREHLKNNKGRIEKEHADKDKLNNSQGQKHDKNNNSNGQPGNGNNSNNKDNSKGNKDNDGNGQKNNPNDHGPKDNSNKKGKP